MKSRIGEVQSVVLDKSRFPTREKAEAWAKENGFDISTSRETENTWRIRQFPPEECGGHFINRPTKNDAVSTIVCVANGHSHPRGRHHFVHFARPKAGQIQRRGSASWEEATNRHQRKLVQVFDKWSAELKREIRKLVDQGATTPVLAAALDAAIPRLERRLSEIQAAGVMSAVRVSAKSRADNPAIRAIAERQVEENLTLIKQNLIPRIHEKLTLALATGAAFAIGGLNEVFNTTRAMPAGYSGGYWVAVFEVQKGLGKIREDERTGQGLTIEPIRWVLDPMAEHCQPSTGFFGCPELAGEYPGGWSTLRAVPAGTVTCRGNCRCHIEVYRDGEWRRGVYAD